MAEAVACLPPDTLAIAGIHPQRIRGRKSPKLLPPAWYSVLEPFRGADLMLLAYDGSDVLIIAAGRFRTAPPGAVLLTPQLALAGSPASIRAATTQHAGGRTGTPDLVAQAAPMADKDIWAVLRGGVRLPLPGNAANANRLLALTRYTTANAQLDSEIRAEADGHCATPESARQLEERLRALITLAKATMKASNPESLLSSIELRREDSVVHLTLHTSPQTVEKLLGF
jgi:hypothetical protein